MRYLAALERLSYEFVRLVVEALGLAPDGLARFYDAPERMQHRSKVRICKFSRRDGPAGLIYICQRSLSTRAETRSRLSRAWARTLTVVS